MVSCFISRLVILIFGTLYPAYASYKAVRTKNVREYVKWMMYWIVFALFTCAETFTDLFLSFWFPFYYEIKIITVIYLLSPATKGSSILYRKFVHPVLTKREQEIDEYIAKAKEQGYHTMLNLGSKGVTYATSLIMQTAIKGGGGLVNHLRRSYSLSDLDEEQNLKRTTEGSSDDVDSSYVGDSRLIQPRLAYSPRRTLPSVSQPGLYFPEVNICERPKEDCFREIPSSEEISSGYSSGDPLYYGMQNVKVDHLVRTASLGPSSRVRTRAAAKNGLFKKGSLAEGGSSWTALESHESQNETEIYCNSFLSHSASCPFPYASFQPIVFSQYQQLLSNFTQNQTLTFAKNSECYQMSSKTPVDSENQPEQVLSNEVYGKPNDLVLSKENIFSDSKSQTVEDFEKNIRKVGNTNEVIKMNQEMVVADEGEGNREERNKDAEKTENYNLGIGIKSENEIFYFKEKSFQERSGKYNKKPAPTPPAENIGSVTTLGLNAVDEEAEFFTPDSSPKLERKHNLSSVDLSQKKISTDFEIEKRELLENKLPQTTKKSKSKIKKGDFSIQKKLHMPKMTFSFWSQKGGKQSSASESSSIASAEIPKEKETNKDDLECFIFLKESDDNKVSAYATLPKIKKSGRKKV